ncbi:MAG: HAMP domain-containing protein, partial [Candidatus Omnitrophica bacterium]|nr:HAMP domain-containing protein [Candidatus Omnitrophota bacterium]
MKIKLPWKLTIVFCLAVLFGLSIGYFYLTSHLKSYLEANLESSLKRELFLSRGLLENRISDRGGLIDPDGLADRIGQELGVRATIVASDGKVLGDSELDAQALRTVENHGTRIEIRDAFEKGFGKSRRYSYTLKKYLLYVATPFGEGKPLGVIRLAMPLSQVELFEAGSQRIVLISLAIAFLLSLGFTFIISVVVSRPLREMAAIAQAMALGDFSRKPSITSRDEMGELAQAVTYMSDEIRGMIERLRQEGARLDAVLSSMSEGIMAVDEKGRILLMNPAIRKAFFVDAPPEGKTPAEVIRNTAVLDIVGRLLKGQDRLVSQEILIPAPEEKIFKLNAVAIIRDKKFEGAVLVFHDITEVRRLEKVRQDFVANVSHELRTPVASIKGYAETLLEGALDDKANAKEFVGIIQQNSDRLASLINDLLDLAKIESGKMDIVFMPVGLNAVVARCLGVLEKTASAKGLKVQVHVPEDLPKVR